jgi:hypothetical protein
MQPNNIIMNKIVGILLIGSLFVSCTKNESNETEQSDPIINKELAVKTSLLIDSLYGVDQNIQIDLNKAAQNGEHDKMKNLYAEEAEIFERHIPILKNIYNTLGYPTIELVGKESSSRFFTLVQHSDSDVEFQEAMLVEITKELKKGNVSGKNYAFLTDRVQIAQGKPQIFGTQLDYNTDIGQAFPKSLTDSINVNKRRKEIGLEPVEEYLNKATEMHFLVNKARYEKMGINKPILYETK